MMSKKTEFLRQARLLTASQLAAKINQSRKTLLEQRQERVLGKLKNFRAIERVRKEIAQLHSVLDEKVTANITENK